MNWAIFNILAMDGLANGAVYGLLALAIVLVFTVTRVIFIPQGDFIAYGALTLAVFQAGGIPGTVLLLIAMASVAAIIEAFGVWKRQAVLAKAFVAGGKILLVPAVVSAIAIIAAPLQLGLWAQSLTTLMLITPFGPLIYRVAYQSLAESSVLVLLIVSVGVHFAISGLALLFFGAEGYRNPAFLETGTKLLGVDVSAQMLIVFGVAVALIASLWSFFERNVYGKALRATAINSLGARLMGVSSHGAGRLIFGLATFIGALSGLLIGPTTTVFYDTGFLIGLKGFTAAVIAGLASYPGALVSALVVGVVESFGSFHASAFKEVIVFTLILPVLLWRSFRSRDHDEEK